MLLIDGDSQGSLTISLGNPQPDKLPFTLPDAMGKILMESAYDEAMMETADSIKQYGVLVPAIARPDPEGGYELVAGHRRHRASELAEKETMPVIL